MNPRLAKEFRAVLLPWCVALVMAIVIPLANFLIAARVIEGGAFVSFILGLVVFAFFSSLLAIAASPFGTEFQHRTLPLLLSQPISRSLIWKYKLIASSVSIGSALLVLILAGVTTEKVATSATTPDTVTAVPITATVEPATESSVPGGMSREQAEMYQRRYGLRPGIQSPQHQNLSAKPAEDVMPVSEICLGAIALLLPTLGSVTFWTLLARSTLGGMVFTAFSQLLVFGILGSIAERLGVFNYQLGMFGLSAQTAISALASITYGGIFFTLSWRKLSRLEVSQLLLDTLAGSKSLTAQGLGPDWLRCRPSNGLANLIRKEIQLQKPLLIIAAILCVVWVLSYILLTLQPSHSTFPEIIFALTIGFYIPLMSLLSGSASLGEEKNLGITAWHLTFPVSIWRQWAVKLAIGFCTWLCLGLLLPFVLTRLGFVFGGSKIVKEVELGAWLAISLFMTGVYALSFWAMTLFTNTVRAVIGSLVIVIALCSAGIFAFWLLLEFVFPHPVVRTLLDYNTQENGDWMLIRGAVLIGASTVVLAFIQSRLQFRLLQTSWKTAVNYSGALLVFVFLATLFYFALLPFTQFTPAIYLLLFIILLIIVRRMAAPVPVGTDS